MQGSVKKVKVKKESIEVCRARALVGNAAQATAASNAAVPLLLLLLLHSPFMIQMHVYCLSSSAILFLAGPI